MEDKKKPDGLNRRALAYARPSTIARFPLMPKRQDEYSVFDGFGAV
jgi:hypothetical protein